ncbi:MAG: helix-turn-helix transcriptional regulator [Bacilli bacterium]
MENIKQTIAKNLVELRKAKKLTQSELAQKLNYSDKAISKWETGETLPDIEILYNLCKLYGVTLDYLTSNEDIKTKKDKYSNGIGDEIRKNVILALSITLVWLLATILYAALLTATDGAINYIMVFGWSVPASFLLATIFKAIWPPKERWVKYVIFSFLNWTIVICVFLQLFFYPPTINLWEIFIIGIPIQIAIILTSQLKYHHKEE